MPSVVLLGHKSVLTLIAGYPGNVGTSRQWQPGVPQRLPVVEIEPRRKSPSAAISARTSERRFSNCCRE